MKLSSLAIIVCVLFVLSCKKNSTNAPTATLLTKIVLNNNPDSVILFSYDSNDRLIGLSQNCFVGTHQAPFSGATSVSTTITRNGLGLITGWQTGFSYATSATVFSTNQQYTYSIISMGGSPFFQEEYTYTNNNITEVINYFYGSTLPERKYEYTYDAAGNIINMKSYLYDQLNDAWILYTDEPYSYDTKVNPLELSSDAIILQSYAMPEAIRIGRAGPNNVISDVQDFDRVNAYSYNSGDMPSTYTVTYNCPCGFVGSFIY